ncbi:glutamine--tRNA ligase/YqeY domain fusion protein [Porphyromonas gingivalis]|uniref:Glutamine--tRNA ligase n=1 Tax=Porphyromonas gingivalis (strain ATCC 33277 / DSM 20709 / CIP 103683 / JCM 12257 / NCTC 11834 / 2561) TaxID=431947 RepID=B2RM07_PORG3|nr:glutamine--tRNA ligase/YqeY domain fusion protein [Porphyromonas gingivalis]AIJ34677.1 glutamate--tRNA ligase [Porphyromonas gingivalis]ALJ26271.1 glutaminyl-tRNA synthetase [Porphyromonas gingivalis 381]AUR49204.1 glutamine--tRNA ligase [Porphyromonas gingivalis ATCC 33277]MDR4975618.1 glutamine--tRNA ligase/YqeY domain fusion protein [Porphyromonas gingivalis]SJL19450.1 glutamine--tRNA ligase [Porphyromonas gingivalis]
MNENKNSGIEEKKSLNFIEQIVESDLSEGKNDGRIQTRFPPEPNGYLHIGHAKAICIDFGIAQRYGGVCNLRFDDTNPVKEDVEYVDAIREDIEWLGFHWGNIYYASDYFQELYDFAERLIREGHAYVDEQTAEQIAAQKGSPTVPGTASPFRNRPAEESLDLFRRMNAGEFEEGAMTLRAKIDMASSNMHFRDPIIYRIIKHPHHRTGNEWNVYPMYDFAHGQSDYFEGVTHSICTLEFEVHRPLYNYFIELLRKDSYAPRQIEFNRLNLTYTMMSKRKLLQLVKDGLVSGWDDPRMPTLCGYRRRGYTPESIRNFIDKIGYTKYDGIIDVALLEHAVREDLNKRATRVSGVIDPIKLVITNYPEDKTEEMAAVNNPEDESAGVHTITFARELYIEKEDFMEDAPKKYFRMTPGQEVRLKSSYIVRCTGCKKDEDGNVVEVYAEYDPLTLSGMPESNRKVKGTIHWVSARHSLPAEVRLYDRLFTDENPSDIKDKTLAEMLNPDSLKVLKSCRVEPFLADAAPGSHFQFQRIGYFTVDPDSRPGALVFNRTVSLKDSWQKAQKNA